MHPSCHLSRELMLLVLKIVIAMRSSWRRGHIVPFREQWDILSHRRCGRSPQNLISLYKRFEAGNRELRSFSA
jgi:hypothetical protein